jgi:hypothetical protein
MSDPLSATENWFYLREGRRRGPFDRAALLRELLVLDAPDSALVWRKGLSGWTRACLVEELLPEMPPPVPGSLGGATLDLPMPGAAGPRDDEPPPIPDSHPAPAVEESTGPEFVFEPDEPAAAPDAPEEDRERRRRRRRKQRPARLPSYLIPLALFLLVVAAALWLLLRRLNQAPPGQILQQGQTAPRGLVAPPGARAERHLERYLLAVALHDQRDDVAGLPLAERVGVVVDVPDLLAAEPHEDVAAAQPGLLRG